LHLLCSQIKIGTEQIGLTAAEATWGLSVLGLASTIARVFGGILSGLLPKWRLSIVCGGMMLTGVSIMLMPACEAWWSFLLVCAGIGAGSGIFYSVLPVHVADLVSVPDFPKVCVLLLP
jgi:MFS family permease